MGGVLVRPIILTVCIYLFLKFIVPNLPHSAPLPSSLIFLYLMLTTAGIVIFATLSGASKDAFFGPIRRFLTGEGGGRAHGSRDDEGEEPKSYPAHDTPPAPLIEGAQ